MVILIDFINHVSQMDDIRDVSGRTVGGQVTLYRWVRVVGSFRLPSPLATGLFHFRDVSS